MTNGIFGRGLKSLGWRGRKQFVMLLRHRWSIITTLSSLRLLSDPLYSSSINKLDNSRICHCVNGGQL
jgi:hypothetical protein